MNEFNSLVDVLENRITGNKGIIFINNKEDKFITYNELYNKALKALKGLQDKGMKKGSELILLIDDNESFLVLFWACLLGGIIPVPVGYNKENKFKVFQIAKSLNNPNLVADFKNIANLEKFLGESKLNPFEDFLKNMTFNSDEILNRNDFEDSFGIIERPNSKDIAFVQFTSGTTGNSKGVVLTHENLLSNINAIIIGVKGSEEDSSLSWMPLYHDMGLIGFHLTPLLANTNQHFIPTSLFVRRPVLWLKKASEYKVKTLACPNFGYEYFLNFFKPATASDWDLSNVRVIFNGAEYISTEICDVFLKTMAPYGLNNNVMFAVYGGAEASLAVAFPPLGEGFIKVSLHRDFLSIGDEIREVEEYSENAVSFVDEGYPVNECNIKICDKDNKELKESRIGFIHIKGKNVTCEYYHNEIEAQKYILEDGWINTKDLGVLRNGRLIFIGRFDDVIYHNDKMLYPHDMETIAEEIEGIEIGRIAACGVYDSKTKQHDVIVFIFYKKNIEEFVHISEKIKNLVEARIKLKIKYIIPIKEIPKTTSGKIQRYKLVQRYIDGEYNDTIKNIL